LKRLMIIAGAIAILAAPAGAAAAEKPSKADRRQAQQECRTERGTTDESREAFREKYGTNKNKRNAFGKCVSKKAKEIRDERKAAKGDDDDDAPAAPAEPSEPKNAAQECREERGDTPESQEAFAEKYGTNGNKRNAFGKCVSQKAQEDDEA
jgi:hypothetical protein